MSHKGNVSHRYDSMSIFICNQKLTKCQLNLLHRIKQTRVMNKIKNKNRDAQKKCSSNKVRGVSPETRRKSMVGKNCEKGRSWDV